MAQPSKQSGVSAIASEHKVFLWARLKLTGIYVGILAVILLGFSLVLFQNVARNINDISEDDFAAPANHHHFVENTLASVKNEIIFMDIFILIVAAGVSYAFAGYTLRPIQTSMESQKKFAENASHELRTPLAVMKSDIEVLLRNPSPTKEAVYATLRSSVEEIDRLSNMAADLLALARSGIHKTLATERVDLKTAIDKTLKKMRYVANKKEVGLTYNVPGPLYIKGHTPHLERIFTNIFQNAIEHTPSGGSISIAGSQTGSEVIISVSDTGSGIDPRDLPHVFERFYKGPSQSGTGLGLSIVKELISQHRGSVSIESTLTNGTTVTLRFPNA